MHDRLRAADQSQLQETRPAGISAASQTSYPLQRKSASQQNATGIPDGLKATMEQTFGADLSAVQLKTNSSFPAKVGAVATARGNQIDIAPGHYNPASVSGRALIGHEAWHTVQQARGQVKPTMQMKSGHTINADAHLEAEADAMGARVARAQPAKPATAAHVQPQLGIGGATVQRKGHEVVQRTIKVGAKTYDKSNIEALTTEMLNDSFFHLHKPSFHAVMQRLYQLDIKVGDQAELDKMVHDRILERFAVVGIEPMDFVSSQRNPHKHRNHPEYERFMQIWRAWKLEEQLGDEIWDQVMLGMYTQAYPIDKLMRGRLGNVFYEAAAEKINALGLLNPGPKPALWSGGFEMSLYAQERGYTPLEMTAAGNIFNLIHFHERFSYIGKFWNMISTYFIRNIRGEVDVFMRMYDKSSVLFAVEIPELEKMGVRIRYHVVKGFGGLSDNILHAQHKLYEINSKGQPDVTGKGFGSLQEALAVLDVSQHKGFDAWDDMLKARDSVPSHQSRSAPVPRTEAEFQKKLD